MSATQSSPSPSHTHQNQSKKAQKKMNNNIEPEHAAPTEHAIPPPVPPPAPQNLIDLDQLLEDHKLLNRLSQYPLVKTVCEQTSEIFTKAKQMSPQVVSDGLDKAHATIADVINKPAPLNLAPVEDFGCRQLDKLDNALETPIGKSLQSLSSKVAQAGVGLVNKTPLRTLTSSSEPSTSIQHAKSSESNPSITRKLYSDIQEKGLATTFQANFVSGLDLTLTKVEDFFALEHDPHLRLQNQIGNIDIDAPSEKRNQHDIHLPEEPDAMLTDRTVNLAANGVYQVAKRVDNFAGDKLSDQTKKNLGRTAIAIHSIIINLIQMFFLIFLKLPFIRSHHEYISSKMDFAREYCTDAQEMFFVALDQAEKRDLNSKDPRNTKNTSKIVESKNQAEDSKDEELERDRSQMEKPKGKKKGSGGSHKGKK